MNQNLPGISCVCVTYARPHLLEEAIDSFLRQDYPGPKELIVLNDYTPQILEFDHPEVQIINLPYRFHTVGEKMNAGVALARYDLICLWDDDDIILPHRLSLSAARVTDQLFRSTHAWVWSNGELSGPTYSAFHAGSCYPRPLFDLVGGYAAMGNGQDREFEGELLRIAPDRYEKVDLPAEQIYYIYRWHGTGSYHLSQWGASISGEDESATYAQKQVERGELAQGRIQLRPRWKEDYLQLVQDACRNVKRET
ncbi:MAG: glycosyltransferase family 2 protein [Chloroflexi bacterium]|nr:glycosyltransferase family 2 protein [Chloroflexota bacterium]